MKVNEQETAILLVEDEALIAMAEEEALRRAGYRVENASSGEKALELLSRDRSIDLILMDIDLGRGMDGTETAVRILDERELPIVFLTGHAEKEVVEKVKGITRYGYIIKDSGEFVLLETIATALALFKAHSDAAIARARLEKLNQVFNSLGTDPEENIRIIVRETCQILEAACSLYNKLQDEGASLCTWAGEQLPADYNPVDAPEGHICYEATMKSDDSPLVLSDLKGTPYEKSDVNVGKYGLRSYLGYPIRIEGANTGALCIVDTKPRDFNDTDLHIIATLAKGLELEEQRKQSEEQVRKLLNEKGLLLREAYHRIKNDMSVVKSMLSMQASRMESDRAEESLYDASHRVAVLSQVYDRLTSDDGVRRLLVGSLLEDLLQELKKRYSGESVRFSLASDEFETSSRYGIVTGIIFNELVTNAVKNKPDDLERLQVDIECRRSGGSRLALTVVDNGAGFPPDVLDGTRMGLGLELVKALVAQYDGVLKLENCPGARISVQFQQH